ncbi:NhaP-type Na+/H+ or K+/H+ antiporter [Rhizobium leguminosarum]
MVLDASVDVLVSFPPMITFAHTALVILVALVAARFVWVFGSDLAIRFANGIGVARSSPMGSGAATVLSWAGVRGRFTLISMSF